jgi:hypothetical protein
MRVSEHRQANSTLYSIVKGPNHVWNPDYVPEENNEDFVFIPDVKTSTRANKVFLRLLALNVTRRNISGTGPTTDMKHT